MKYTCTLLAVRDMERARKFYCTFLGLSVTADFGANITLSDSIALQTQESWASFLEKPEAEITLGGRDAELYFEEEYIQNGGNPCKIRIPAAFLCPFVAYLSLKSAS